MASLQIDHSGAPNWHLCGAMLTSARHVAATAHRVSWLWRLDLTPPGRVHLALSGGQGTPDRSTSWDTYEEPASEKDGRETPHPDTGG